MKRVDSPELQNKFDDATPEESWLGWVVVAFLGILFGVNLFLFLAALRDQSWGALGIAIAYGPLCNLAVLLGGLLSAFLIRRATGYRVSRFVALVIAAPIISAMFLFGSILLMDLHGC